ncbi:MAG: heparinase II/III family protein [Armatimonadia bacterium]
MSSFSRHMARIAILAVVLFGTVSVLSAQKPPAIDYADWEAHRLPVVHPTTAIKTVDLARAKEMAARYEWARSYVEAQRRAATAIVPVITPEYLATMVERTTPGCTGPCPACRAKGLPWHPSGQWSWSSDKPNQLTCQVCKTVFPNEQYPESIVLQSKWDPEQKFGFCEGDTFSCFGYTTRPSFTGIIRGRKISHVTGQLRTLAWACALTGDPTFARAAKAIFLRFAEVLPKYLVRAGYCYGEYADCDPHVAAERISNLPTDELAYPPNKPDRKLWAGYWAASRVGTSGMDGSWVSTVTQAYDLICTVEDKGVPVFSPQERQRVERDVLLESAYLAACDTAINNKSVGNRAGAAMVGMCVGYPPLVHFGLEGFRKTVDEWFLPDGGTSESPAYAMMTMGGIDDFGLMFRDYSDPAGYVPAAGEKRLDHFDACRDTRYGDCWQSLIWSLQGNLRWAPQADSYRTSSLGAGNAELIAAEYPTEQHLALLKECMGGNLTGGSPDRALFYREPGLETRTVAPFVLPDIVFPFLSQGYLRTGATGRDSMALLNASDYGGHHHLDSLDLYYWKDGRELLSDLGYLWDHPDSYQTRKTLSHNTVLIDGEDQMSKGRCGSFELFATTPQVKVMEASSTAYAKATTYRRTCVQVDHGSAGSYLLDVFRAEGGGERNYVFHGPGRDYQVSGLTLAPKAAIAKAVRFVVRLQLSQVSEIQIDEAEVHQLLPDGKEGPNLVAPPGNADAGTHPAGWGYYGGDGSGEWGLAEAGRSGGKCVQLRALRAQETGDTKGRVNLALTIGESDGYKGAKAFPGIAGGKYVVRFWLKGNAAAVNMDCTMWPNDPSSPADRRSVGIRKIEATPTWTKVEATFALSDSRLKLENAREASGGEPWQATWTLDDGYTFTAMAPGNSRETVTVADGWGQRDHRNSDVGSKLPYIVRTCKGKGLDQFVTVFTGAAKGQALVTGVRVLPLPAGAPRDAVAVEVQTTAGTDLVVSMLTPQPLSLTTALGPVLTDGRLAAVIGEAGKPTAAALVGGTRLSVAGTDVTCPAATYSGRILENASGRGESHYMLEGKLEAGPGLIGQTLFVHDGDIQRAYPIGGLETANDQTKVYTKRDNVGFEARPGATWQVFPVAAWERRP